MLYCTWEPLEVLEAMRHVGITGMQELSNQGKHAIMTILKCFGGNMVLKPSKFVLQTGVKSEVFQMYV